ncbi:MAG: polysaccharide biosynthesis/export family protein [Planctomycetota bacterium]|nr:polysaccharide biosynthesis/export family protein [Planctomycetota bacterium]
MIHPLTPVKNSDHRTWPRPDTRTAARMVLLSGLAVSAAASMGGCEWDSYLRTNTVGRWEHTATKVPILTRIAAIEDETSLSVDSVAPTPEDLYPDPREYRVGPGDELELEIYDLVETNKAEQFSRKVDVRGMVNIPQLGDVFVNGKTVDGVKDAIGTAMKKLVDQPLVGVNVKAERQQTFVIQGAVDQPGPYFIPSPDYKLLEALTAGGRIPSSASEVYVIRQIPIDERVERSTTPPAPPPKKGNTPFDAPAKPGDAAPSDSEPGLIDILKGLSQPKEGDKPTEKPATKPSDAPVMPSETPKDAPIDLPPSEPVAPAPVKPVTPPAPAPAPTPAPTPAPAQAPKPEQAPKEEPKPTKPPEAEPPVPLPGMMAEMAPPKEDEETRRNRMRELERKLKEPLDVPAPPRGSKRAKPADTTPAQPSNAPANPPAEAPANDVMTAPPINEPAPAAPKASDTMPTRNPMAPVVRPSVPATRPGGPDAAVDLPESGKRTGPATTRPAPASANNGTGRSSWVYLNGRWVQVRRGPTSNDTTDALLAGGEGVGANSAPTGPLFAQKVIKVPLDALFRGDSTYNIVIRPGDVVRVPPPNEGEVYVAGFVNRPGSYNLSQSGGQFTLTRAIVAAGGLADEAIPERVDLIRVVGNNQQAMLRVDLRAISEGTQPDILLKKDDMINVGSNFWAFPLAVLRNGFRTNYGFGFLLDRNFGSDVFGAPPESRSRSSF